jgi:hypothetical protein
VSPLTPSGGARCSCEVPHGWRTAGGVTSPARRADVDEDSGNGAGETGRRLPRVSGKASAGRHTPP